MRVGLRPIESIVILRAIRKVCIYLLIHWLLDVLAVVILMHQMSEGMEHLDTDLDEFDSMWFDSVDCQ